MPTKPDQDRVRALLKDTITLLCKNGLAFKNRFCIDAVIGVTLDDDEVFLVSMNDIVKSDNPENINSSDIPKNPSPKRGPRHRKRKLIKTENESESEICCSSEEDVEDNNISQSNEQTKRLRENLDDRPSIQVLDDSTEAPSDDKAAIQIKEEVTDFTWVDHQDATDSSFHSLPDFSTSNFNQGNFSQVGQSQPWMIEDPNTSQIGSSPGDSSQLSIRNPDNLQMSSSFDSQQMSQGWLTCRLCGKCLSTSASLAIHMRKHTCNFTYTCRICEKGFFSRYNLEGHMSSAHTGLKGYTCQHCHKQFAYKQSYCLHLKQKHYLDNSTVIAEFTSF